MANVTPDDPVESWTRALARRLGRPGSGPIEVLGTTSNAELRFLDDLVVKLHAPRTDPEALTLRLQLAADTKQFVRPLTTSPLTAPDGRRASVWPRVQVADPDTDRQPWAQSGALLAGLHRTAPPPQLPAHGWPQRLTRATQRAPAELRELGVRLSRETDQPEARRTLLHGDWHLGQLGRDPDGWRLLDIDDVGVGDPAWDLARPAGFWACGLLDDDSWHAFLDAYRDVGGPAVPAAGDPWPMLDLAARCAVFVAAVRAVRVVRSDDDSHSRRTAETLLSACRRMAQ